MTHDLQMARRLLSGDDEQIRAVIARYDGILRRVARRHVATQHVDDVVQEAWIAALRGVHRYEGRGSFEGWLVTITANLARSWGIRESRSLPVDALPEQIAAPDVEPERRLLAGELLRTVRDAIEGLTPKLRTTIVLRDLHGLSAEETVELLDIDDRTQRVRLHRARTQVREHVDLALAV
jgi:RNA polymerase sigma-70 factor (ECF subfamily)